MNKIKFLFNKYSSELFLGAILLLAAFLRLDHLSLRALWLDEADVANALTGPFFHSWSELISSTNNLAYFYTLKIWSLCFGTSEGALRSLSVVFSLLSIIAIYRFGRRLRNRKVGLWAAFLLAVNYFSIFYAIQARQYSLVILLSTLSYYYFYLLLQQANYKKSFLYIIFTVLGIYSHPWFFILFMSQIFYLLFKLEKKKIKIIINQIIIFILSLPWLMVLWKYKEGGANSWIKLASWETLVSTFHYFMYGATGVYIIILLIIALFIVGHFEETETIIKFRFNNLKHYQIRSNAYLLLNYLFFSLIIAFIIGCFIPFYESGRYEAIVLPPFILLLSLLLSRIKKIWFVVPLILLLSILSYQTVVNERRSIQNQKTNNRMVVRGFLNEAKDNDWIIFTGLSRPPIDYYLKRFNVQDENFKEISFPPEMISHPAYQNININKKERNRLQLLSKTLIKNIKSSAPHRVWLVFTANNPSGLILKKEFDDNFSVIGYLSGPYYDIILYKF